MKKFLDLFLVIGGFLIAYWVRYRKNIFAKPHDNCVHHKHFGFKKKKIQPKIPGFLDFFNTYPFQITAMLCLIVGISISSVMIKDYGFLFKASLINVQAPAFDGTTFPIKRVPIWTALTDQERVYSYNQIPKEKFQNIPVYDLSQMRQGLEWKPNNAPQRNTYITYPVPYMGNYRLDGTEHSGSHLGVDIKVPKGTPIYAVANGVVYKTQNQKTGFGNAIAISHTNVPDPENNGRKTNLISVYAHLSQVLVKSGSTVRKGQLIGKSGSSGASTAPHLHFQLDRDNAPFSPYWHFSWNEVQKAGYNSFFTAVKKGFHKREANLYTVNPVTFVTQNTNFSINNNLLVASNGISTDIPKTKPKTTIIKKKNKIQRGKPKKPVFDYIPTKPSNVKKVEVPPKQDNKIIKKSIPETPKTKEAVSNPTQIVLAEKAPVVQKNITHKRGQLRLQIKTDRSYVPGVDEKVEIIINEANLVASNGIELSSTLRNRAQVYPSKLTSKDFKNGVASVVVKTESPYPFKIVAKGDFGRIKSESLRPEIFTDVPGNHIYAKAIKFLKDLHVIEGYKNGAFKPDNTLNRAESVKLILEANSIKLESAPNIFTDIKPSDWFAKYVNTAFKKEIIKGYKDQTFKAQNTISRAEFLKIAIETAKFKTQTPRSNPFPDVVKEAWFAKYFQFAKQQKLLRTQKGGLIAPNNPISRGEAAEILYRLSSIKQR